MREPKAKEMTLVFVGQFNPVIINPNWLSGKKLISDAQAEIAIKADNYISHPEITQFKLDNFSIQTVQNKYTLTCTQEGFFDQVKQLTDNIFTFLNETPVMQLGINTVYHYEFSSEDEWHAFGHRLAPKKVWEGVTLNPGLKEMQIQAQRKDDRAGEINIKVDRSPHCRPGIRIAVNDHYQLYSMEEQRAGKDVNAQRALEVLGNWNTATKEAIKIIEGVME